MKRLFKSKSKFSKREKVSTGFSIVLLGLLALTSSAVISLKKSNKDLSQRNTSLDSSINTLKEEFKKIGESLLASKSPASSPNRAEGGSKPSLNRQILVASPSETTFSFESPNDWKLIAENRISTGDSSGSLSIGLQAEDIDLFTVSNYEVSRVIDSLTLKSGQTVFLVFIKTSDEHSGYLGLSFCNPDTGQPCSYKNDLGKHIFFLAHGYEKDDQFVRDVDFNTPSGIKLIQDLRTILPTLDIQG